MRSAIKYFTSRLFGFEDAPKAVEAAANAVMDCVVLTTMHIADEYAGYENIIGIAGDYHDNSSLKIFS